jgi:hypothetical protein
MSGCGRHGMRRRLQRPSPDDALKIVMRGARRKIGWRHSDTHVGLAKAVYGDRHREAGRARFRRQGTRSRGRPEKLTASSWGDGAGCGLGIRSAIMASICQTSRGVNRDVRPSLRLASCQN